jgi:hypothetical protein
MDGYKFASAAEMRRYAELKLLMKAGDIYALELQPRFVLQRAFVHDGKKERAIVYIADFKYCDNNGHFIVEDVKGVKTAVYKLKRKMMLFRNPGIDFREVAA